MSAPDLPEVTDAHRQAAFAAMHWPGWTFESAMQYDLRRRLIECRAHQLRTSEWMETQQRSVEPVQRCRPGLDGHPLKWCTQLAPGPLVAIRQPDLLTPSYMEDNA